MSWDCQSAEYTMKLNNSDLPQEKRRSQEIKWCASRQVDN